MFIYTYSCSTYIYIYTYISTAGIKVDERVECMTKASAYITMKDHKDNFRSAQPCGLIK